MEIYLKPIGIVHVKYSDNEVRTAYNGVDGILEIYEDYIDALDGLDGFSHIIVISYLHKTEEYHRKVLKVKPRRFAKLGIDLKEIPEVGVFCTDSPHRPNPIAITIVRLINRRDRFLYVDGLDLFDGTPILDIKPYTPGRIVENISLPDWYKRLIRKLEERGYNRREI
jgi:tRNA-Thr(GGU) m(6)t(6)A37 methyltransferase TsaA